MVSFSQLKFACKTRLPQCDKMSQGRFPFCGEDDRAGVDGGNKVARLWV